MGLQMTFGKFLKMTAFGGVRDFHARVWAKSKPKSEFNFLYSAVLVFYTCRFICPQYPAFSLQSRLNAVDSPSTLVNRGNFSSNSSIVTL